MIKYKQWHVFPDYLQAYLQEPTMKQLRRDIYAYKDVIIQNQTSLPIILIKKFLQILSNAI